jgi:hypothetical protein
MDELAHPTAFQWLVAMARRMHQKYLRQVRQKTSESGLEDVIPWNRAVTTS